MMSSPATETDRQVPRSTDPVAVLKQVLPLPEEFSLVTGSELRTWVIDREVLAGREVDGERGIRLSGDSKASKQHALLRPYAGGVELLDHGSKNHTFVNGKPVTHAILRDGAVVRMGNTLFVLRVERPGVTDAPYAARVLHERLLGRSQEIRALRNALSAASRSLEPVLLCGPTGTGKELGALAVHALSAHSGRIMVAVNCAAIPSGAAESALFGHRRGSFTGADREHDGYFRQADGSTLLLDELGELPLEIQAKLLRTLEPVHQSSQAQGRNLLRVQSYGGQSETTVDVRVIAATHVDLRSAVAVGKFREDLLQRLSVIPVRFPSLTERRDDILPLAQHYLNNPGTYGDRRRLSARLGELLVLYRWPGNVRELLNLCKRLRTLTPTERLIDLYELPQELLAQLSIPTVELDSSVAEPEDRAALPLTQETLARLLTENDGKISRVAKLLGRSARQIRRRMDEFGMFRPFARSSGEAEGKEERRAGSNAESDDE